MAVKSEITGFDEVLRNLDREVDGIKGRSIEGLLEAGLQIEAAAKRRTPVDTGNLRASAYTIKQGDTAVVVGYTAAYAPFVHEATGKLAGQRRRGGSGKGLYWETGEPKFLQKAVEDNLFGILDIVRHHARVDR